MRCRELARDLIHLDQRAVILGPPESLKQAGDDRLFYDWLPVASRGCAAEDFARVTATCKVYGAEHLVMDDHRTNSDYQARLRSTGLRWLQFYDASRPCLFQADFLVNSSPFEKRADYLGFMVDPGRTATLFGPAYAVLRPAFAQVAARADGREVQQIFVSFGGGNDRGATALTLTALAGHRKTSVDLCIVSGRLNPHLPEIEAAVAEHKRAELHVNPSDMAALMRECDLAVISGGTTSYEAAICGLPTVLVAIAPNQLHSCQGWQEATGALYLGRVEDVLPTALRRAVHELIDDDARRTRMAATGRALVDGYGARRLNTALLNLGGR